MASNAEEVRRAAIAELARRELERREQSRQQQPEGGFGRQLGLGARAVAQGLTDLAYMPFDALAGASNYLTSKFYPEGYDVTIDGQKQHRSGLVPTATRQRDEGLTGFGLPEPETSAERVANIASRGAIGAGGLAKAASLASGPIASTLAQQPLLQTISGATGGASSQTAQEMGYGPAMQIGAGILGAAVPGVLAGVRAGAANSSANASARATPGIARTETSVSGGAQVSGRGGGYQFGDVIDDASAGLNVSQQRAAARGRDLGFRMTPGQATGSRALQQLEAKLESQPMTSGPFNAIRSNNQTQLNRSVAQSIGVKSDVVDDSTLSLALQRMQTVFDDAADDATREIDPRGFISWLSRLQDDTRGLVNGVASHPLIEDITAFAQQGQATGRQLQSLTSKLGRSAVKQMTTPSGDRDLGIALYRAKDFVDDLLMQGMDQTRLANFQQAREQYRNLMLITSRTGIINPSSGNVSGVGLAAALQAKDRRGYLFGGNRTPMYDAARFAQAFKPIVGDSGTATRSPLPGATDFVLSLPFNLATRAYTSSPAINLAVGAQAAGQRLAAPLPQMGELPAAGILGSMPPVLSGDGQKRRRMIEAAMSAPQ